MSRLENLLANAGKAGWEWFDQLPDQVRSLVEIKREEDAEKAKRIARAWAAFATTVPGGAEALEALFSSTLDRTVWFVQLGEDVNPHGKWGYFREGQNAVAHAIRQQVNAGLDLETKPRDTDGSHPANDGRAEPATNGTRRRRRGGR